jgi:hypothetical protein
MPEELLDDGNALGMLRAEHEYIKTLMGNVYEREPAFARQALIRLMEELQIHSAMERQQFIPLCETNMDTIKRERFDLGMAHHEALEELTSRLEGMDVEDPAFGVTMEQLIHRFQQHCFAMEETMFIALEGGDWDMHNQLVACAMRMRELRTQLLDSMKRPRSADAPTFQDLQHRRAQEMGRGVYAPRDVVNDDVRDSESGEDVKLDTEGNVMNMGGKTLDIDSEEGTAGR